MIHVAILTENNQRKKLNLILLFFFFKVNELSINEAFYLCSFGFYTQNVFRQYFSSLSEEVQTQLVLLIFGTCNIYLYRIFKKGFSYSLKHYNQNICHFHYIFPLFMNDALIIIIYFEIRICSIKIRRKYSIYIHESLILAATY